MYGETPLSHKMLVIAEATALNGQFATYALRTLLSEGRLEYETVEKTTSGLRSRRITREGPTGVIITTTAVNLHRENETRLLSLSMNDTRLQTHRVLLETAKDHQGSPPDEWLALQEWLALGDHDVVMHFAKRLAGLVPPVAVRFRRDFKIVLSLIKAHAVLHQQTRRRDKAHRIIATRADYVAVRDLVGPVLAEGLRASVPAAVRETVDAVNAMNGSGLSIGQLGQALKIDPSAASRRAAHAAALGYIVKEKEGRTTELFIGVPLPQDTTILPDPAKLFGAVLQRRKARTAATAQPPPSATIAASVGVTPAVAAPPQPDGPPVSTAPPAEATAPASTGKLGLDTNDLFALLDVFRT